LPRLLKEVNNNPAASAAQSDVAMHSNPVAINEARQMMQAAHHAQLAWGEATVNQRVSVVRQQLAHMAGVPSLMAFADDLEATLKDCRQQLMDIETKLAKPILLPGPTGERNTLHYEPRGVLVCLGDKDVSFAYWALSIVTALATGNAVISVVSDVFYDAALQFQRTLAKTGADNTILQVAKLNHVEALLAESDLAGVVIDPQSPRAGMISSMLAQRDGAILPVITAQYNDNLIQRVLTEKTISIDTTASGGNTSLMTLVDQDE
jgi:RHH-type proline utilization regulon transcriptional repressor/proline dehydrogenase/delta 1-pyrroline-5-carboxylate dehydrogenase